MGHIVNHDYRLGKLLRIDPATGAFSIFSYGLRNPWRFSYDRTTGDLIIGDVGQGAYEEVDFAAAPGDGAGSNYGWNTYEGAHTYPGGAAAGARGWHDAAGRRVPARPGVLDHGRLRRARSGAPRARRHLPLRRQLHGRHHRRNAAGGHHPRTGLQRPERVELRRGRLRARLRRFARRRRLPLREQRRVRRAGALRRPAACRGRRARPRPGPIAARRRSPCCAPRRASTRCAPASSRSACAATSCAP